MEKFTSTLACLAVLVQLGLTGCFPTRQDLLLEKQGRLAADEQTRATEQIITAEQQRLGRLRIAKQQDQQGQIQRLETKHQELLQKFRGLQQVLKNCQQEFKDQTQPKPRIEAGQTRIWEDENRYLCTEVGTLLSRDSGVLIDHFSRYDM